MPELPSATDVQIPESFWNFIQDVRAYLRDYPEVNRLVSGMENSDKFIARQILLMLDEFAGTPPPLGYFDLESLIGSPYYWKHGCLLGTLAHILRSVLILANRNTLNFSDGNISVALEGRLPVLQSLEAQIRAEWRQALMQKKISMNISGSAGLGGAPSEYSLINAWIGSAY